MTGADARLAVVIATHAIDDPFIEGLEAHRSECEAGDEIIVVAAGSDPAAGPLAARFPAVRWLHAPAGTLTPRLWSLGLSASSAPLARLTIGPCRPAPGWRRALVAALGSGAAAVGGAIQPGDRLRSRDRALYLLRYRNYRLPFKRSARIDLPGDHAAYLRRALVATRTLWRESFWEMDVNRALAEAGERLIMEPGFVSHYLGGERACRFLAQRFRHGIHFGRARLVGVPAGRRWALALAFVLPGAIFLGRILRESGVSGGRPRVWTAGSLPWLIAFVASWSLGEWVGALQGPPRTDRRADSDLV